MHRNKKTWLTIFLFGFIINVYSQNTVPSAVTGGNEKIFIHFDRPYYHPGETIWYKVYLTDNGLPSFLSNEIYLKLQNEAGKIIDTKRNPVTGSSATGDIELPTGLAQGYYLLKAITKGNKTWYNGYVYTKKIFIYNNEVVKEDDRQKKDISLKFFPESGRLVDRIRTQVAFKATNEHGIPVDVSGMIISSGGTVITSFKSLHDGIGRVSFTPHLGDLFFAELEYQEKKYRFPLPVVFPSGICLKITGADSGKIFAITRSRIDKELYDSVRLIVKMNDDTAFENSINFGYEQAITGFLNTSRIPSGLLHFILLNKDGMPLAERLSFVNNKEYVSTPAVIALKRDTSRHGFNSFGIIFPDTVQRSLSVSVSDFSATQFPDKENIFSRILLSSSLEGDIYNPAFYFKNDDSITRVALDNVMLVYGWTNYIWKKTIPFKLLADTGSYHYLITISGTINNPETKKKMIAGKIAIQLIGEDSTIQSFEAAVDKNGKFSIDSLLFFGNANVYYNYISPAGKIVPAMLLFDRDSSLNIFNVADKVNKGKEVEKPDKPSPDLPISIDYTDSKYKQLDTVFLVAKERRPSDRINEKYTSSLFKNTGKVIIDNITHPYGGNNLNVIDYILDNIQNLDIYRDENILVNKKNFSLQSRRNWKVELFVDENISGIENVRNIDMSRVALIKFYEAGFVGVGSQAPGGAVAVYLKKYDDEHASRDKSGSKLFYKGYSLTKEFYQPDYPIAFALPSAPDNRLTLYWKNLTVSGASSKNIKFDFFNNDFSKKLMITIEGFDVNGKLIHYEATIGE